MGKKHQKTMKSMRKLKNKIKELKEELNKKDKVFDEFIKKIKIKYKKICELEDLNYHWVICPIDELREEATS